MGRKAGQPVNSDNYRAHLPGNHAEGRGRRRNAFAGVNASMLAIGVERVILGTAVLTDRALWGRLCERWGERIAVGLDARDGRVAVNGWRETSGVQATCTG